MDRDGQLSLWPPGLILSGPCVYAKSAALQQSEGRSG